MDASATSAPTLSGKLSDGAARGRPWWTVIRLVVLAAIVFLIARRLHHGEIRAAFTRLSLPDVFVIIFLLSPLGVLLRALRWRYLLPDGNHLPLRDYIGAYLVGVLANSLLLGRFGDLVKARFVCGSRLDYGRSLAVVAIDRVLEGTALLLVFSGVLLTSSLPGWAYTLAWTAGLGSVAILVGLRLLVHHQDPFLAGIERIFGRLPSFFARRTLPIAQRLIAGCEVLTDLRRVVTTILYAVAVWGVEIATVMIFLARFSVPRPWFVPAVVMIVVLNFGMLVPISPGSVGVYQVLCSFVLSLWGVSREVGLSLGIAMQTVLFLPLYAAGALWLLVSMRHRRPGIRVPA